MQARRKQTETRQQICDDRSCSKETARDLFIFTADGDVTRVTSVVNVHVNEAAITFECTGGKTVIYPRMSVFYTCCKPDRPPAEF